MNEKIIEEFIKKNFFKTKFNNNSDQVLLIDRGIVESAILNSLFAYILNKKYLFNIDLLYNYSKKNKLYKVYDSFGIRNIININIRENLFNIPLGISTIFLFLISFFKIIFFGRSWFVKKYKIKGIYFGDLIYDEYIRHNHNFLKRNLVNIEFLKILLIRIFKINFINQLLSKKKYKYILAPTHTYASNSALGLRIALKKNIKVLNILSNRLRIYSKPIHAEQIEFALDRKLLNDKKIFSKNWEKKFNIMLKERYSGKIKYHTAIDAYFKKKLITKKDFLKRLKLDQKVFKRIVFFAPHCFSDTNHRAGRFIFDDYFEQFQHTIELAKKDLNSLWIIKIHPQSYKYKEENLIYKLLKKNYKNIIICPENLNTYSLIKFSDLIITGRGTIGLETSCFGKKPILAGENFYSNYGITHDPSDANNYCKKILDYNLSSKLNNKQILLAKKLFYLLVFKNSFIEKDKILVSNYLKPNIKLKKMEQQFLSTDEFLKNINYHLNKKVDLSKDKIFQNFEKIFIKQA